MRRIRPRPPARLRGAQRIAPPAGVESIPVPAGHRAFLVLHARGVPHEADYHFYRAK